jgi:hypothetical protein
VEWVEIQLAQIQPGEPFQAGAAIMFEGRKSVCWDQTQPRLALSGDH